MVEIMNSFVKSVLKKKNEDRKFEQLRSNENLAKIAVDKETGKKRPVLFLSGLIELSHGSEEKRGGGRFIMSVTIYLKSYFQFVAILITFILIAKTGGEEALHIYIRNRYAMPEKMIKERLFCVVFCPSGSVGEQGVL